MQKIIFEDTTVVKQPYVEINGVEHEVHDGEYQGGTDLDAETFNTMQNNIGNYIDGDTSMGSIIVEDITCKNLFDKNNALKGYELSSTTGGTISNSTYYTSDYIEVIPSKKYYLTKSNLGSSNCFYDSNKNFISVIPLQTGVLTIPDNSSIKYVRFNGSLSDIDNVQFEKGEVATDYVEHKDITYSKKSLLDLLFGMPNTEHSLGTSTNANDLYTEYGIKSYSIWGNMPKNMPSGAYAYGTLIVITNSIETMFLNIQIYIPDGVHTASSSTTNRGVYIRTGQSTGWARLYGGNVGVTS